VHGGGRWGARPARWLLALLAFAAPTTAAAQETREYDLPDLEEPPGIGDLVQARLTLADRFVGNADFGSFDVASNQPEGRLRIQVPISDRSLLRLMATTRAQINDFDGVSDLFGTGPTTEDPFETLLDWRVRLQYGHWLPKSWTLFSDRERWAAIVQGAVGSAYEVDASPGDGLRGGGGVGVFYRLGRKLEVAAGVRIGSRLLESGVSVSPFLEFDWRINRNWRIKSYGLGLEIERLLTRRLRLVTRARLESSSYRLADRGDEIGLGALRVRQLPVGIGLRWDVLPHLRITALAGAVAYHQLRVKSEDDEVLSKSRAGASPYLSLRIDVY
jgi:hypothetical protein